MKHFFYSLFENETEEELFEKLSKFPLYERRKLKEVITPTISPIDEKLRHDFSQEEKEVFKNIFLGKISFHFFAEKLLLPAVEFVLGYSKKQMQSKIKTINIVKIRCIIVALLYKMYRNKYRKVALEEIGKIVNRDYGGVVHEIEDHNIFWAQDKFYRKNFLEFINFFFPLFKDGEEIKKEILLDPFIYSEKKKEQLKIS